MKVTIALCLIAVAQAGVVLHVPGLIETGSSVQTRTQDSAGNYQFAYNEQHTSGGSSRAETGDAWGRKAGSYSLNVADGRRRAVNYVADGLGFRASVATNEPGTKASIPANAPTNAAPGIIAPVAQIAAPIVSSGIVAAGPVAQPLVPGLGQHQAQLAAHAAQENAQRSLTANAAITGAAPVVTPIAAASTLQIQPVAQTVVAAPIVQKTIVAAPVIATPAIAETGASVQSRTQDSAGNFQFAYNEQHTTGGSYRSESGNAAGVVGEYGLNVADGRRRAVRYVADGLGFRASVATNEPGTKPSIPANAPTNAASAIVAPVAPIAPVVAPVAPIVQTAALAPCDHPVAVAAPAVPSVSSFSSAVQHNAVVPAAPVVQAPVAVAPVAVTPSVSSFSSSVQHTAPVVQKTIVAAAPVAPIVPQVSSFSSAVSHGAPVQAIVQAPVVQKTIVAAAPVAPIVPQVSSFSSSVAHNAVANTLAVQPIVQAPIITGTTLLNGEPCNW